MTWRWNMLTRRDCVPRLPELPQARWHIGFGSPTSAWAQLRLVGADAAGWADALEQYSRLRSRVGSGIEATVSVETVDTMVDLVSKFLNSVEFDNDDTPAAA